MTNAKFSDDDGATLLDVADLLMLHAKRQPFKWGLSQIAVEGETRRDYLNALRAADNSNYEPLIKFAKNC